MCIAAGGTIRPMRVSHGCILASFESYDAILRAVGDEFQNILRRNTNTTCSGRRSTPLNLLRRPVLRQGWNQGCCAMACRLGFEWQTWHHVITRTDPALRSGIMQCHAMPNRIAADNHRQSPPPHQERCVQPPPITCSFLARTRADLVWRGTLPNASRWNRNAAARHGGWPSGEVYGVNETEHGVPRWAVVTCWVGSR